MKVYVSMFCLLIAFLFGCSNNTPISVDNSGKENQKTAEYGDTVYYGLAQENQELVFLLFPWETGIVNFQPWKTGNWKCYAWHSNLMLADKFAASSYYWRDAENPNDPYHWWANDANGYLFVLRSEQDFYSGSPGITYEIRFKQWTDYFMPVHVLIVPD